VVVVPLGREPVAGRLDLLFGDVALPELGGELGAEVRAAREEAGRLEVGVH
jgi:hypothetical protein